MVEAVNLQHLQLATHSGRSGGVLERLLCVLAAQRPVWAGQVEEAAGAGIWAGM